MGEPGSEAEEAPALPAESKFLERKETDNIYHENNNLCENSLRKKVER
jgi:hypothetical protein